MKKNHFAGPGIFLIAVAFLVLWLTPAGFCAPPDNQADESIPLYTAYYFYTSKRCGPCTRIEQWSETAVNQNFTEEIQAGQLEWKAVNIEKLEHRHFIKDFQLYTKSVIIAEYRNGKPVRWKNLKKVWQLYRDREKYFDYIADEIKSFMEKSE